MILASKALLRNLHWQCLCVFDEKTHAHINSAVKKTLKRKINYKKKKVPVSELKGSHTSFLVKKYFLDLMPLSGWCVYSITVNKEDIQAHLETKTGKNKLYNFLTQELLKAFVPPEGLTHVSVVVDKSKGGEDCRDFNIYIKTNLEIAFGLESQIYITHENSQSNPGLQAVDLFCWGIQKKQVLGDNQWFDCYKSKIENHTDYCPKQK